jgi:hypothetical protein
MAYLGAVGTTLGPAGLVSTGGRTLSGLVVGAAGDAVCRPVFLTNRPSDATVPLVMLHATESHPETGHYTFAVPIAAMPGHQQYMVITDREPNKGPLIEAV